MSFFHLMTANVAFRAFRSAIWTFREYSFSASPSPNATRPRKWSRFSGLLVVTVSTPSSLSSTSWIPTGRVREQPQVLLVGPVRHPRPQHVVGDPERGRREQV